MIQSFVPIGQRGELRLLKSLVLYFLGRAIPGAINFLAIVIYTRLLTPQSYGQYALTVSAVGFCNVVFFQWLRLSFGRFFPKFVVNLRVLKENVLGLFLLSGFFPSVIALAWVLTPLNPTKRFFPLLGLGLLLSEAWFELNLTQMIYRVEPVRYGVANALRAGLSLILGVGLIFCRLEGAAPILGILVALILLGFVFYIKEWKMIKPKVTKEVSSELLWYGLPLTGTFLLAFIVHASDRFVIAWFLGQTQAGIYSSSYDLAQQPLTLLMTAVNLLVYPLAVWTLETKGYEIAKQQLKLNAVLILGIGLPATIGMVLLAQNISLFLGKEFRAEGVKVLPWVTLAAFLSGMKAYYFDLAFQLGRKTIGQLWISLVAAAANLLLNFLWIPKWGILGAAYATVVAYGIALLMSMLWGRKVLLLPIPCKDWLKIAGAVAFMGSVLRSISSQYGWLALCYQIAIGGTAYWGACLLFNICGLRKNFAKIIKSFGRRLEPKNKCRDA